MKPTRVNMGRYTLHLDLSQPYVGSSANEVSKFGWREILVIFNREAARLSAGTQATTPEAIGIAGQLAQQYTREQFTSMVHLYWMLHAEDLEDGYGHPLKAFAAKAPYIAREAKSHVSVGV